MAHTGKLILAEKLVNQIKCGGRLESNTFRYSRAEQYDKQEGSRSLNA